MKRFFIFLQTELLTAKTSIMFHIAAFLSPLIFLMVFAGNLAEDITFPINIHENTPFSQTALTFSSPTDIPYLKQNDSMKSVTLKEPEKIALQNGTLSGRLVVDINAINTNITKNYRNRVTGAITQHFLEAFPEKAITITEHPLYRQEPCWVYFFSVSICMFGIILSGFLFGSLSFCSEWESNSVKIMKLSPRSPALFLAGKLGGAFLKGAVTMLIYFVCSYLITGINMATSLQLIPFLFFAYFFSICAGMITGLFARQTLVSFIISLISALGLWVFGGGFGTSSATPGFINALSGLNPVTSLLRNLQHILYASPSGVYDILYPSAWMIILAAGIWFSYRKLIYLPARSSRHGLAVRKKGDVK